MRAGELAYQRALMIYETAKKKKEERDPSAFGDFLGLEEYIARAMRDENSPLYREKLYALFTMARQEHRDIVQNYILELVNSGEARESGEARGVRSSPPPGREIYRDEEDASWIENLRVPGTVRMSDVVGLEREKEYLMTLFVHPFNHKETKKLGGGTVLLYGPPGTGKTFLVRALAGEKKNGSVYNVKIGDVLSKYYGESSKRISQLFRHAGREDILYFDEIDALFGANSREFDASSRTLATLLSEMDGAIESSPSVVGSTNRPDLMDAAAIDRFEVRMYIPPPDIDAKMRILKKELEKYKDVASAEVDWTEVREAILSTEIDRVHNARSMKKISEKARILATRDFFREEKPKLPVKIETEHYLEAIQETSPPIPRSMIEFYETLEI